MKLFISMNSKLPITRISKFFSQDDFDLNIRMGEEYLHGDLGMKLVLFRVDRQKTDTDEVYGEVRMKLNFYHLLNFTVWLRLKNQKITVILKV